MNKLLYIIGSLILFIASLISIIAVFDWDNVFNFLMSTMVKSGSPNWVPVLICVPFVVGLLVILAGCCIPKRTENLIPEAMPLLPLKKEGDILVSPREADEILNYPTCSPSNRSVMSPLSIMSSDIMSPAAPDLSGQEPPSPPTRLPRKPKINITPPDSPPSSPSSPISTFSEKYGKSKINLFAKPPHEAQKEAMEAKKKREPRRVTI